MAEINSGNNDINKLIANYAQANNLDVGEVKEQIESIIWSYSEGYDNKNTQFDVSKGITADVLNQYISIASGKDKNKIKEGTELLHKILDANNDGILTGDELQMMGGNDGNVSGFEMYNWLGNYNSNDVGSYTATLNEAAAATEAVTDYSVSEEVTVAATGNPDTVDTSTEEVIEITEEDNGTKRAFSNSTEAIQFLQKMIQNSNTINSFEEAIESIKKDNLFGEEDIKMLEDAVKFGSLSESETEMLLTLINAGKTPDEAYEYMKNNGMISDETKALATENLSAKGTMTDAQIMAAVTKFADATINNWGCDGYAVDAVINRDMNANDIVAIAKQYNERHPEESMLITMFRQSKLLISEDSVKIYAEKLCEAANNGNKDAIELLEKELKNSPALIDVALNPSQHQSGRDFIKTVMDNLDTKTLKQLNEKFKSDGSSSSLAQVLDTAASLKLPGFFCNRFEMLTDEELSGYKATYSFIWE